MMLDFHDLLLVRMKYASLVGSRQLAEQKFGIGSRNPASNNPVVRAAGYTAYVKTAQGMENEFDLMYSMQLHDGAPDELITKMGVAIQLVDGDLQTDSLGLADNVSWDVAKDFDIPVHDTLSREVIYDKAFEAVDDFKERVRLEHYKGPEDHSSLEKGVSGIDLKLNPEERTLVAKGGFDKYAMNAGRSHIPNTNISTPNINTINALPPSRGGIGSGECCVFNPYGGGGCGACSHGASMSSLRLAWRTIT